MTDQQTNEPKLEPATTRTSGRSARVAAVAIGALLVSVVYVGMTGSGSPSPSATTVDVAMPRVSTAPDSTSPRPTSVNTSPPVATKPRQITFPNEAYELTLHAGRRTVHAPTYEWQPGVVSGLLYVPGSFHGDTVSLEISVRPQSDPLLGLLPVWTFDVAVPRRAMFLQGAPAFDVVVTGFPSSSGVPGIESNGYRVSATYALIGDARAINVILFVNANPEMNVRSTHRWVTGDDGLVGWPTALSR